MKLKECKICGKEFKPSYSTLQKVCSTKCAVKLSSLKTKEKRLKMKISAKSKDYKKELQKEINKLSKNIDNKFNLPCIDCGVGYKDKSDKHGAHFHNVGGNENLRFNLDNIHSARVYCNYYNTEHKLGYYEGLITRYGKEYADYIRFELPLKYPVLKLSDNEIYETLKTVRKINREFDTYQLKDSRSARALFNKIINIYK